MITARVRVERVDEDAVWVVPLESGGCGRCNQPGGCGASRLLNPGSVGLRPFLISEKPDVQVGDQLWVGIQRPALWRSVFAAYGMPTLLMLAGGSCAAIIQPGDLPVLVGVISGLGVALVANRIIARYVRDSRMDILLLDADDSRLRTCHE